MTTPSIWWSISYTRYIDEEGTEIGVYSLHTADQTVIKTWDHFPEYEEIQSALSMWKKQS